MLKKSLADTPLRNLALAFVSTLGFAGLLEGVARYREPPPVQREEYLWDWSERFKDGDFYTFEKGEGYPPNEENNVDGLRDVTRPIETRSDLRRIAILGDSVTYGHGVEGAEAFPQLLERTLRETGRDVEVFNAGLPGWSTRQERIAYQRIVKKYRPNVVVLAVCLNDLPELQINLTKPPAFLLWLFKRSAVVRLAMGASKREIGAVEELFTAPESARVRAAFRLFFDEVKALRNEVRADGADFHVALFPFRFQVASNPPAPTVQRSVAEFAAAEKISLSDFLAEISGTENPSGLFLDYDHFNQAGHQRVAKWLAALPQVAGGIEAREHESREAGQEAVLRAMEARGAAPVVDAHRPATAAVSDIDVATGLAVDDPSPRVRFEAARAVFYLHSSPVRSLEVLIRGLSHDDPRVRAFATWTLGEMGEVARPALSALVLLARKDGGAGKTGAITAIGKIGESPETIPLLLEELKHPKEAHRYRAARTLGKMGEAAAPAVTGLIEALADPSPLVRLHVVRALGGLGAAAKAAIPTLIEVMNQDPDPEVRKEVSLTLSRLPGR